MGRKKVEEFEDEVSETDTDLLIQENGEAGEECRRWRPVTEGRVVESQTCRDRTPIRVDLDSDHPRGHRED